MTTTLESLLEGAILDSGTGIRSNLPAPLQLIYRPAGTAAGNVYTDFNTLWTAFLATASTLMVEIILDAGATSGATINVAARSGGGSYDFDSRAILRSRWPLRSHTGSAVVTWSAGTTIINLTAVDGLTLRESADTANVYTQSVAGITSIYFSGSGGILNSHATNAAFLSVNVATNIFLESYGTSISSTAGKEAIINPAAATGRLSIIMNGHFSSISGTRAVKVDYTGANVAAYLLGPGCSIAADTLATAVSTTFTVNVGAAATRSSAYAAQTLALGTLTVVDYLTSANASITAAGVVYATATQLAYGVSQTSTCAAGAGVRLPTAAGGLDVIHSNDGANAELIYPFSGDNATAGVDVAITLAAGATIHLVSHDGTTWKRAGSNADALTSGTLDQFADVTQTSGKTLAITDNTTLAGGTHSGTNTGDQTNITGNAGTVTVADAASDTTTFLVFAGAATGSLPMLTDAAATYDASTDTLALAGSIALTHAPSGNDEDALDIVVNAGAFSDIKAIHAVYTSGALATGSDEAVILVSIDEMAATGGDVYGLEVLGTAGSASVHAIKAGAIVNPILQDSGTFANPTTGTNDTPSTNVAAMIDGSTGTNTTIFVADNDYIIIGAAAPFTEIQFAIQTPTTNPGIVPTFAYSTAGAGTFTTFGPVDGTNGFRNSGVVAWDAADLTAHGINSDTGTYDIKITRTHNVRGNVSLYYAKTSATVVYSWDKNGAIIAASFAGTLDGCTTNTESVGNDTTQLASTAFVQAGITPVTITPTAIGAAQNNYSPTSWQTADVVRVSTTGADYLITGFAAPSGTAKLIKRIVNVNSGVITLSAEDGSSTAANRITNGPGAQSTILTVNDTATIVYDATTTRWRVIAAAQAATIFAGGAFGTPSSIVLTNATGLPTAGLVDDAVTYAKIQNVSATDKVLGRSTAGAGDVEEIACTATGRSIIDDASIAAVQVTIDVASTQRVFRCPTGLTLSGTNLLLVSGTTYCMYIGYFPVGSAHVLKFINFYPTVAGTGAQTAEVALGTTPNAPTHATNQTVTILGATASDGTLDTLTASGTTIKRNTTALNSGSGYTVAPSASVHLYACLRVAMASTQPTLAAVRCDFNSGHVLSATGVGALTSATTFTGVAGTATSATNIDGPWLWATKD